MSIWCWTKARSTLVVLKLWCAEAYGLSRGVSQSVQVSLHSVHVGRHSYVHGISCAHSTTPETMTFFWRELPRVV